MFVSTEQKFVYVPFTKVGSSSMFKLLKENYRGVSFKRTKRHIPNQYINFYKFCIVRNPYDRMMSWWNSVETNPREVKHINQMMQQGLPITFEGFLKHWKSKTTHTMYYAVEINGDFDKVLRLENIQEDFNSMPFVKKDMVIPQKNSRSYNKDILTPRCIELINEIYENDFKYFGYEMR